MINYEEARKNLDSCHCYRASKGNRSITFFKSKDTPDIYYWYVIHDVPVKIKDKPIKIKESEIYDSLYLMISSANDDKDLF